MSQSSFTIPIKSPGWVNKGEKYAKNDSSRSKSECIKTSTHFCEWRRQRYVMDDIYAVRSFPSTFSGADRHFLCAFLLLYNDYDDLTLFVKSIFIEIISILKIVYHQKSESELSCCK